MAHIVFTKERLSYNCVGISFYLGPIAGRVRAETYGRPGKVYNLTLCKLDFVLKLFFRA